MTRAVWLTASAPPIDRALAQALISDAEVGRVVCVYDSHQALSLEGVQGVSCVRADLNSYRSLRELLSSAALRDVDTIVHAAPRSLAAADGARARRASCDATRRLLHVAEEQASVRRFVLRAFAGVYRIDSREQILIDEGHALELVDLPADMRAAVEADFIVCEKLAGSRLQLVVLRCAEVLARGAGSPLYDYLSSRVCLRPLGYDPMLNVLSLEDLGSAVRHAVASQAVGVFNVPGHDTLPLSELVHAAHGFDLALPSPALAPLYALRARLTRRRFDYKADALRFHYGCVLDGSRARAQLGYVPQHPLEFAEVFGR